MGTRTLETRWGGLLLAILLVVTGAALAGERSTGQAIDDTLITTKIKASFAADPQVSALAITVETDRRGHPKWGGGERSRAAAGHSAGAGHGGRAWMPISSW